MASEAGSSRLSAFGGTRGSARTTRRFCVFNIGPQCGGPLGAGQAEPRGSTGGNRGKRDRAAPPFPLFPPVQNEGRGQPSQTERDAPEQAKGKHRGFACRIG